MHKILVVGAGRIGKLIALLLSEAGFEVKLADKVKENKSKILLLDINDQKSVEDFFKKHSFGTIVSCVPYYLTARLAEISSQYGMNYFDVTEDIYASKQIKALAKKSKGIFVPRCGLAPGIVGIFANDLIQQFESVDSVTLRVGGLPQYAHNLLHYVITWSIDGLINSYGNMCQILEKGKLKLSKPLEDLEELEIDGMSYEAFSTSGGVGNLIDLYKGKINQLCYKTIRYPGHCEKMRFLMQDLKLNEDRKTLKQILENVLPESDEDVVIIDISVIGKEGNHMIEKNKVKKYYPQTIAGKTYSALQVITAASLCAVIDVTLNHPKKYRHFVYQEGITLDELKRGKFARYLF